MSESSFQSAADTLVAAIKRYHGDVEASDVILEVAAALSSYAAEDAIAAAMANRLEMVHAEPAKDLLRLAKIAASYAAMDSFSLAELLEACSLAPADVVSVFAIMGERVAFQADVDEEVWDAVLAFDGRGFVLKGSAGPSGDGEKQVRIGLHTVFNKV